MKCTCSMTSVTPSLAPFMHARRDKQALLADMAAAVADSAITLQGMQPVMRGICSNEGLSSPAIVWSASMNGGLNENFCLFCRWKPARA